MKRFPLVLVCVAMLAAGVLAAQSMASGAVGADTTTTTTTATTETQTDSGSTHVAVKICHVTGSKKKGNLKYHTLTVDQHAAAARLKHGDTAGACPAPAATTTSTTASPTHGNGHGKGKGK